MNAKRVYFLKLCLHLLLGRFPGVGCGKPLQYSCLKNFIHRQMSLAGYSP